MNGRRTSVIAVVLVVALAAIPPAVASSVASLQGEVVFEDLIIDGGALISADALGALSLSPGVGLNGIWRLEATSAAVNWTHATTKSYGFAPGSSGAIYSQGSSSARGEETYASASIILDPIDAGVNFLAVGGRLELPEGQSAWFAPSAGETWRGGSAGRAEQDGNPGTFLAGIFEVSKGVPRGQLEASPEIRVVGNFSFYSWASYVNVTTPDGDAVSYRSGVWDENVVAPQAHPRGVARDEHNQLLRVDVHEGRLVLSDWSGVARFTAPRIDAAADGRLVFGNADAYMETNGHFFRPQNETFSIEGVVSVAITPNPSGQGRLTGRVEAEAAETDLVPSGPLPEKPSAGQTGQSRARPMAGPSIPVGQDSDEQVTFWVIFGGALYGVMGAFALWFGWRRMSRRQGANGVGPASATTERLFLNAEEALIRGDSRETRRWAARIIEKEPMDPDAWFLHGASLLQEDRPKDLARELEPVAKTAGEKGVGLAFLLCIAFIRLGKLGRARRWSKVAEADPDFRVQLEQDEAFRALRPKPAASLARPPELRVPLDVAYG